MLVDYKKLKPIPCVLTAERILDVPKNTKWFNFSLSPQGDIYGVYRSEEAGSSLCDPDRGLVALKWPKDEVPVFFFVQRFLDGRWLLVESRVLGRGHNAFVFEEDGTFSHSFHAGDGIEDVLVDQSGGVWIGYFDEGVFGDTELGSQGLVQVSDTGELEFGFHSSSEHAIDDLYALTVDHSDRVWLCPYGDFFVGCVEDRKVSVVLERSPVSGAYAICVGPRHIGFLGGYDSRLKNRITIVDLSNQWLRSVQLFDREGDPLVFRSASTRGGTVMGIDSSYRLFRFDLAHLLQDLKGWTRENSSTVGSALEHVER